MEMFDIYDKDRVKTGRTVERGKNGKGDYHIIVHVAVICPDGKMIIQKRQPFKHGWPGMWDISLGGSVIAGETSSEAARRESMEELGLDIDFSEKRPAFTVNFLYGFDDYYIVSKDVELSELTLQPEEVEKADKADYDEICGMIDRGEFIPYHKSLIKLIFDMAADADKTTGTAGARCSDSEKN